MASKLKVDSLETTAGTGTIALSNQLSGMTVSSLPTLTTTEIPTLTSSHMPAGSVIQVVESYTTSGGTSTSTSWSDMGMSVSITPSSTSSKILLIASLALNIQANNNIDPDGGVRLLRGSTVIHDGGERTPGMAIGITSGHQAGWTRSGQQITLTKLDSPSATSSTTYKAQFKVLDSGDQLYHNVYGSSTMTVMEIKG